jgi:hypothetical protein
VRRPGTGPRGPRPSRPSRPSLASRGWPGWPDRARPGRVVVAAACTKEGAGCHNHAHATAPACPAEGPVRPGLPVVRQIAPGQPVNAAPLPGTARAASRDHGCAVWPSGHRNLSESRGSCERGRAAAGRTALSISAIRHVLLHAPGIGHNDPAGPAQRTRAKRPPPAPLRPAANDSGFARTASR